jgi:hypothetical protein
VSLLSFSSSSLLQSSRLFEPCLLPFLAPTLHPRKRRKRKTNLSHLFLHPFSRSTESVDLAVVLTRLFFASGQRLGRGKDSLDLFSLLPHSHTSRLFDDPRLQHTDSVLSRCCGFTSSSVIPGKEKEASRRKDNDITPIFDPSTSLLVHFDSLID